MTIIVDFNFVFREDYLASRRIGIVRILYQFSQRDLRLPNKALAELLN